MTSGDWVPSRRERALPNLYFRRHRVRVHARLAGQVVLQTPFLPSSPRELSQMPWACVDSVCPAGFLHSADEHYARPRTATAFIGKPCGLLETVRVRSLQALHGSGAFVIRFAALTRSPAARGAQHLCRGERLDGWGCRLSSRSEPVIEIRGSEGPDRGW